MLDGAARVADLVAEVARQEMPAIAMTDHGNMYGAFQFWQAVDKQNKSIKAHNEAVDKGEKQEPKKNELKCIIGCELYVCKDHKDKSKQEKFLEDLMYFEKAYDLQTVRLKKTMKKIIERLNMTLETLK
jgi:DNA polymerase-3 subunit alpha